MAARSGVSRRQLMKGGLVTLAASGLAACATVPAPQVVERVVEVTPTAVPAGTLVEPKGVLKVSACPNSAADLPHYEELFRRFREAYPDIELETDEFLGGSTDDYKMKKLTEMAAGIYFDAIQLQGGTFSAEFFAKGIVLPLDPYIDADVDFNLDDIFPAVVDTTRYNGSIYGATVVYAVWLFLYNTAIFDAKGTMAPRDYMADGRWTWTDGMLEAALANNDPENGQYGIMFPSGGGYWGHDPMANMLWSNNADFFKPDPWRCSLDESAAVESLQFIADLMHKHKVTPQPGAQLPQGYELGYCSMSRGATWFLSVEGLRKGIGDLGTVEVMRNPYGAETGYSRNQCGTHIYSVPRGAKNPGLGWTFLKWYSTEGQKLELENYHRSVPFRKSLLDYQPYLDVLEPWENPAEYAYAVETARLMYGPPNASEAVNYMMQQWDNVLLGAMNVDEYVADVKPHVDELVSRT